MESLKGLNKWSSQNVYLVDKGGRQLQPKIETKVELTDFDSMTPHQKCALLTVALFTTENYINELTRQCSSERAQNEWQGTLNTILSRHRCRNSGTWTKGSDRPSGEEIALSLIGWLGAAGAQISRFQEENGFVKWTGTVCSLCVSSLVVSCAHFSVLNLHTFWMLVGVFRNRTVHFNKPGTLVHEKSRDRQYWDEDKGDNSGDSTKWQIGEAGEKRRGKISRKTLKK